jgi:hypothetical protein
MKTTFWFIIGGITFFVLGLGIGHIFVMTLDKPVEVSKPTSNFEVIDTYNGCDVVRYAAPNGANYHYFLDCQK